MSILRLLIRELLTFVVAVFMLAFLISCSQTTAPQNASLVGVVRLINDTGDDNLDPIDFSGVTVSCYPFKVAVNGLQEAIAQYPQIGFNMDDRGFLLTIRESPLLVSTSSSDGSYSVPKIAPGEWIVKFSKEAWGDRYFKVSIASSGEIILDLEMFPPQIVSGSHDGDLVIQTNRELVINGDFVLFGNIIANGQGIVKISSNANVRVQGSIINNSGELLIVTSTNPQQNRYYRLELINPEHDVIYCLFSSALTGLYVSSSAVDINVSHSMFYDCEAGYLSSMNSSVNVNNSIFAMCASEASTVAALNQHSASVEISRNIFIDNKIGLRSADNASSTISDNYFLRNYVGAESSYQTQDVISYNTFIDNEFYAIRTASLRSCVIEYNDISGPGGIQNFWFTTPGQAPQIHNNNINAAIYAIYTSSQAAAQDVDAAMNYFYTTSIDELNQLIWDENDRPLEYPTSYPAGYVIFVPYRTSRVVTAGIRY